VCSFILLAESFPSTRFAHPAIRSLVLAALPIEAPPKTIGPCQRGCAGFGEKISTRFNKAIFSESCYRNEKPQPVGVEDLEKD